MEYDLSARVYEIFDKDRYIDLYLIGDESEKMIKSYIYDCAVFVIEDCGVKGEAAVLGA